MKLYIYFLFVLFISCGITKNKKDSKLITDTKSTETGTVASKRDGDTLTYTVLNPILKDTTIYIRNKTKENSNTLRISYDKQGLQEIKCISAEIDELKNYIRETQENTELNESEKTKETVFKPIMILWLFLGLAFLIVLVRVMKKFGI